MTGVGADGEVAKKDGPYPHRLLQRLLRQQLAGRCASRALQNEAKAHPTSPISSSSTARTTSPSRSTTSNRWSASRSTRSCASPTRARAVVPALRNATRRRHRHRAVQPADRRRGLQPPIAAPTPAARARSSGTWLNDALRRQGQDRRARRHCRQFLHGRRLEGRAGGLRRRRIEVLAFKDTDWSEDKAKVVMSDLIAAYPADRRHLGRWRPGHGRRQQGAARCRPAARSGDRRRLQRPAQALRRARRTSSRSSTSA